jgi:hypothetical protein
VATRARSPLRTHPAGLELIDGAIQVARSVKFTGATMKPFPSEAEGFDSLVAS